MGRREEDFVRAIAAGRTWKEAADDAGLSEERAAAFLESVATFAGSVTAPMEFGLPKEGDGGSPRRRQLGHRGVPAPVHRGCYLYGWRVQRESRSVGRRRSHSDP